MLHYMIKKNSFVKNPIYRELNFTLPWDLTDGISSFYATYLDGLRHYLNEVKHQHIWNYGI